MFKNYKTEINPTPNQQRIINRTIGVCRYVYNLYLARNKKMYEQGEKFVSGMDFSKWLNNEYLPNNRELSWVREVSAKSVKQSIMNAERAYKNFFNGRSDFPKFKKKSKSDVKMYFVKNDATMVIHCERHRVKIPTLGWVRIKEKAYIPTCEIIRSGTVSKQAGRYYVSVMVESPDSIISDTIRTDGIATSGGVGIDLGLKEFAVVSNGNAYKNINKTSAIRKAEKKLKREQRRLSRKCESLKQKNKNTEGGATRQNIQKQVIKVQRLHQRLSNIRTDYINKIVNDLVKTKPSHITIEDLNVSGMMKNRHLSKAVAQQKFYEFRLKLEYKCSQNGIELRIVDRFYPSSKMCHECGNVKTDLRLSDRTYKCECGYVEDRDYNASLNLRDAKIYKTA